MNSARRGMSLIEILIVIAIIAVLLALLFPAVQRVREVANSMKCSSNLRQIGIALNNYQSTNNVYPPGYTSGAPVNSDTTKDTLGWSWATYLLNAIEQDNLRKSIDFTQDVNAPANATARLHVLNLFRCPSDAVESEVMTLVDKGTNPLLDTGGNPVQVAVSNYVAVFGTQNFFNPDGSTNLDSADGIFYRNSQVGPGQITDSAGQTLMIGERSSNLALGTWAGAAPSAYVQPPPMTSGFGAEPAPALVLGHTGGNLVAPYHTPNNAPHVCDFWSRHIHGVNFLMADGSVHFISDTINPTIYMALGTKAGREPVNDSDF